MAEAAGDASVGRFEICEFIGDLFHGDAVPTEVLIETAVARGARPAVIDVLRRLDRRHYHHFTDLDADLAYLPAAIDPWDTIG